MYYQETEASAPKRPKLSQENEQNNQQLPVAGPSNGQTSPKLFKLDIDCFDEIFEYLSLADLDSFGQTCKAMHTVAGEYFKRNYSNAELRMAAGKPRFSCFGVPYSSIYSSTTFNQFVTNMTFETSDPKSDVYFSSHPNEFRSINNIIIKLINLNDVFYALNGCLRKLEVINIRSCHVKVNLRTILKRCDNIKTLSLKSIIFETKEMTERHSWMRQKYPKLEHLELIPILSINGLELFFQKNPNLQTFSASADDIWEHRNEIVNFRVQLDLLKIRDLMITSSFAALCTVLNQLYDQKFYRRLHIEVDIHKSLLPTEDSFGAAFSSLRGLERLNVYRGKNAQFLPKLPNLKELKIHPDWDFTLDSKLIPEKFVNLQGLWTANSNDESILSIVQRLPKLKMLALRNHNDDYDDQKNILKLSTLDKVRQKILGAQKLTIYVPEEMFLRTKWSIANGDTNLKMIEIKRYSSRRVEYYH